MANLQTIDVPQFATAPLLTVEAAARCLGLSRSTIYQLMDSGQLAYCRFGRARRIDPADLESLKAACRVGPAPHSLCDGLPQRNGK
jgi:excisionase family DNA binding protein